MQLVAPSANRCERVNSQDNTAYACGSGGLKITGLHVHSSCTRKEARVCIYPGSNQVSVGEDADYLKDVIQRYEEVNHNRITHVRIKVKRV